jgi:hypothetical protein
LTLEARILRGQAAERLLNDETFQAVHAAVEEHYRVAVFKEGLSADDREALFAGYRGFQRVEKMLAHWRSDGLKVADEVNRAE